MHIGIDASRVNIDERTGTENYSYHVINALAKIDTENDYTLYFREKPKSKFFQELTNNNKNFEALVIKWPRLWTQGGLALELLFHPVDVMFISAHTMPFLRRPDQKFVVTIHGLEYMYMPEYEKFPQKLYLTKSTEFVSRYAQKIVAVSEFTKKSLLEHGWGATEDRIDVIPEGVNTELFTAPKKSDIEAVLKKYKLTQPYFFFVSTIQPRKNVVGLIEAFAEALPALDKFGDYSLVLAGKSGWKIEAVRQSMEERGIAGRVKLIGRVPDEDLPALYAGARAFVYPSFVEGFGLPALESMACGTPCVLTDKGAVPEVGGKAAIYVDPYQIKSIAEGLATIAANDKLHDELVKKGKQRIKHFTWEKTAQKLLETFESMVEDLPEE